MTSKFKVKDIEASRKLNSLHDVCCYAVYIVNKNLSIIGE